MEKIHQFIDDNLKQGDVPRMNDVVEFAILNNLGLSRKQVMKQIRLHPAYMMNLHQQREAKRARKQRPILANSLGHLHADLGFYPVVREYSTPKTFRHGFFVAKDVLSRFTYVELLKGPKSANNLIRVLERIIAQHKRLHGDYAIKSISFDKEPAMMSAKVQTFLKRNNIQFYYFEFSATKAKVAEGAIKLIRADVQRLMNFNSQHRWWKLLQPVVDNLNRKEIVIQGKKTGFSPKDLTQGNVKEFLQKVHKLVPGYYFAQFRIPTQLGKFKFEIGDIVRPKIITTSAQVIGNKTSQVNLSTTRFKIEALVPFVTTDLSLRSAYKCVNLETGEFETFSEEDLALST